MSAKVKTKRNSWFDVITSMFQNMKVGATTKKSTKSSPTSSPTKRLVHSKALNTAHRKLIRLRHAFQCQDAHCTKPSCPSTKKLLMHISTCKKKNCDVSDCIISRRLLSHYRYCTNMECPLCMPIRVVVAQDVCQKRRRRSSDNHTTSPTRIKGKRRRTESVIALLPTGSPPMGSPTFSPKVPPPTDE